MLSANCVACVYCSKNITSYTRDEWAPLYRADTKYLRLTGPWSLTTSTGHCREKTSNRYEENWACGLHCPVLDQTGGRGGRQPRPTSSVIFRQAQEDRSWVRRNINGCYRLNFPITFECFYRYAYPSYKTSLLTNLLDVLTSVKPKSIGSKGPWYSEANQ